MVEVSIILAHSQTPIMQVISWKMMKYEALGIGPPQNSTGLPRTIKINYVELGILLKHLQHPGGNMLKKKAGNIQ